MDWNEPYLFPSLGWRGRVNPGDLGFTAYLFADTSFEGGNDFSQCLTLTSGGTFESWQIRDACPYSTASVRRHVDNAIEDRNFGWLRSGADVQVDVVSPC